MNIREIKNILGQKELTPLKQLGQNFLIHSGTVDRLVQKAGITGDDNVVELGVGLGSLTRVLAREAKHVTGLEIDRGIIEWHREAGILPENVTLLSRDMLKADYKDLASRNGAPLKIIANLPYSISSPLVFKLIEERQYIEWAVLMFQKEVAIRLQARPGTRDYGILSVLLSGSAEVKKLLDLSPGEFYPQPKVDSRVLQIRFQPVPGRVEALPDYDEKLMIRIVKSAFQKRRKTIASALSSSPLLDCPKQDIVKALEGAGINPQSRAEELAVEEYVSLTGELVNSLSKQRS